MTLVRGAARRAAGPPAGALLTASGGPFELRTGLFTLATDAATVSVWMRGHLGTAAERRAERGGARASAPRSQARPGAPCACRSRSLRGHRVALTIASADATGLQLAYIGTVQRRPALHVQRFVAARPGSPVAARSASSSQARARSIGRAHRARAASRRLVASHRLGQAAGPGARADVDGQAAAPGRGARGLHGQRGGRRRRLARAHPPRVIAHLDLDAFFAAVEQLDHPELRGKPVVVGGDPRSRGVVSTASYEARKFGIRSAMSAAEAYRRCPKAIFVRPDMARYRERSRTVWSVVGSLVERYEQVGIDEGYLDLAGLVARAVGRPRAARRRAGRGARRDRPLVLARLRHGQDRRQDRERPPQARRHLRGRARPRGGLPGAARRCARCPASARAASSSCWPPASPRSATSRGSGRRGAGGALAGQGRARAARARARRSIRGRSWSRPRIP